MLILDCNYICWTCAHAFSKGLSYKGSRTEVIYGFMEQLLSLMDRFELDQIAFCWDSKPLIREEIYPEYKSNRRKNLSEDDAEALEIVYQQFDEIKKIVVPGLGFKNNFDIKGYESDDIIAKICITNPNAKNIIVSSDEDLYQLLDFCSVYSISKKQTMDKEVFKRHYAIEPKDWVMVKTLAGCKTDHVKGIAGVGEKKAIAYIKGELTKGKIFQKIKEEKEKIIEQNKILVELPFPGLPTPNIRKNKVTLDNWNFVCKEYGLDSLRKPDSVSKLKRIIRNINK